MRVLIAAALVALLSSVGASAQPNKPFDPNMDYDEMQRQYLPGMMKESQSDKMKQQAFIRDCVKMMTVTFISQCKKNIASLDTSVCDPGIANRRQAEKSCRAMVQGQAVQWETDSKGRYEPRTR
jgi:hypothetical protein